ncbi:hypothetical protein SYJ56_20475 [Algoriphagus sp. D3-2-R+10]|uniref:hypothetical protein n=1 Tax=Algoriphagus aurantiacus TaxID=3103948 RepID=UPI002B367732|nr:hypothetical protein [Algoriphagus sp. D3-2-R+10]MEB2777703.1 hypothetical protein [Algoriphagus sp. D3-2-R+10]
MNNIPNNKPDPSEKEGHQLFNKLTKSVAGLLGIVVLLVGLVLLLVFLPEISANLSSNATEGSLKIPETVTDSTTQLVDGKDVATGLLAGEGLELVKANCTNCHSSALILQNRFTREGWHAKIVWMQETQGLWELGESESIILDYLAANYAPAPPQGRRMPLSGIEWYELED